MRIRLKKRGVPTYRIESIRQSVGKRFWVRRDGVRSTIIPEATAAEIAEWIRRWILAEGQTIPSGQKASKKNIRKRQEFS